MSDGAIDEYEIQKLYETKYNNRRVNMFELRRIENLLKEGNSEELASVAIYSKFAPQYMDRIIDFLIQNKSDQLVRVVEKIKTIPQVNKVLDGLIQNGITCADEPDVYGRILAQSSELDEHHKSVLGDLLIDSSYSLAFSSGILKNLELSNEQAKKMMDQAVECNYCKKFYEYAKLGEDVDLSDFVIQATIKGIVPDGHNQSINKALEHVDSNYVFAEVLSYCKPAMKEKNSYYKSEAVFDTRKDFNKSVEEILEYNYREGRYVHVKNSYCIICKDNKPVMQLYGHDPMQFDEKNDSFWVCPIEDTNAGLERDFYSKQLYLNRFGTESGVYNSYLKSNRKFEEIEKNLSQLLDMMPKVDGSHIQDVVECGSVALLEKYMEKAEDLDYRQLLSATFEYLGTQKPIMKVAEQYSSVLNNIMDKIEVENGNMLNQDLLDTVLRCGNFEVLDKYLEKSGYNKSQVFDYIEHNQSNLFLADIWQPSKSNLLSWDSPFSANFKWAGHRYTDDEECRDIADKELSVHLKRCERFEKEVAEHNKLEKQKDQKEQQEKKSNNKDDKDISLSM